MENTSTGFCWGSRAVIPLEVTMTVSAGASDPIFSRPAPGPQALTRPQASPSQPAPGHLPPMILGPGLLVSTHDPTRDSAP